MANPAHIQDLLIEDEMKESYLAYAMSVIVSRALPDVRDGLKPSQRRILVAMDDLNLGPNSKYRKCAKIVGDTSGNYHPHGDQAIYPTLVRMAQPFNMRYLLVDGQGNFGSIDGDPPAAMRYTECRLTHGASMLLEDLKYNTVEFAPNYDDTRKEPTVLPGPFPNLLANGSSGIAVGMATSIPPHNLGEVADAIIATIDHPEITIPELMDYIKGPDFPTGGIICGRSGILEGYQTGRSNITLRAKIEIEEQKDGKSLLVVTEIPFQVTKNKIIEKIVDQVKQEKLRGIADIRDESDREGMRLVIIPKRGEDPEVLKNLLFKHTQLQSTFSIIMIALKDGRPYTFNLKEMIQAYIQHRFIVITRKTRFLLEGAKKKAHELEGLLTAFDYMDEIINIIRGSQDIESAKAALIEFFQEEEKIQSFLNHKFPSLQQRAKKALELNHGMLTAIQADMILKMRLQALTGLEREKLESNYLKLMEEIKNYEALLSDSSKIYAKIREDTLELKKKFADPRRTQIEEDKVLDFSMEELIPVDDFAVTISESGYIKRVPLSTYRQQGRGGKGIIGADTKEGDVLDQVLIANSHDYILFFTNRGRMFARKVYEIPEMSRTSPGRSIANLLDLEKGESITSWLTTGNLKDEKKFLMMITEKGYLKKTPLVLFSHVHSRGIMAIRLEEGDSLIETILTSGSDKLVIGTRNGKALLFKEEDVRPMGREARGVRGIRLKGEDRVCGLVRVEEGHSLITITEKGYGKRTDFKEYRLIRRGGQGVINMKLSSKSGRVVGLHAIKEGDDLVLITSMGKIIRIAADSIRLCGRNTLGVRLIRLDDKDLLVSSAKIKKEIMNHHEDDTKEV